MSKIEGILKSPLKPKEKVGALVNALEKKKISGQEFMAFFKVCSDVDKGTCADAMKHISKSKPEILGSYLNDLIKFINYPAPRVKWGVPEAVGNLAKKYPEGVAKAIPSLLKNTTENEINTTVIKWCAAYALAEIAKNCPQARKQLLPIFSKITKSEKNNGVKNVYFKALKVMEKEKS